MRVAIVTDSNSGIFEKEGQELGIYVVPMPIFIEGKIFYEGIDLTHEEFCQSLLEHKEVSSSQPSPGDIIRVWERALSCGYEEVVHIPMSSGLSGSYQTAGSLARKYAGKVHVVDNHRVSVTQRHSVQDALALTGEGCSAEEIKRTLERTAYESVIYVGVETLEYLKKNGRVTPAGAAMSTVLNIKPLLVIEGERLDAFEKVRGTKKCRKRLIQVMKEKADKFQAEGTEIRVGVAGCFGNVEEDAEWLEMVRQVFMGEEIGYGPLTFSIGCHVGAGAFGMGISRKVCTL